jgi:hypothetical protein
MKIGLSVVLGLLSTSLLANASDLCPVLPLQPQYSSAIPPKDGCSCGSSLRNVVATLNNNFRLGAVCDLRWVGADGAQPINLRISKVSLDSYTNGNLPFGQILLVGHSTLEGTLTYEPGNSGELWFEPRGHPISGSGTAFSRVMSQLKLARAYAPAEFHVPISLRKSCWTATATIQINDVWVTIGESDEAGAYPAQYRVISVVNHKAQRCG